ncbi:hypothetical protein C8R45DRAFT_945920 [Mycena sanguinolenta]|nr:hypothetical protein C8R45DRAFT_945920 [Mycena sanguinolenta]
MILNTAKLFEAPSQATILEEILASEQKSEEESQAHATTPVSLFLNVGLKLQARQIKSSIRNEDQTPDTLVEKQFLATDLEKWHQQQRDICPQVVPYVTSEPYKPPESEKLFLPSDFTNTEPHKNACNNAVHGQAKNTWTVQKIKDVQTKIQCYVSRCEQAPCIGGWWEDRRLVWWLGHYGNLFATEEAEYVADSAKVQWHCAHAQLDRWQEEVKIIAQFSRAIQGFEKMKTVWTALADNHKNDPKRQTHALKTSNMYQQMENKGREKFREVGGTWPQNRVSLSQYIQCERLDRKITGEAIIFAED